MPELIWAVWWAVRLSKYAFISKWKKKSCPPSLSAEGNEKSRASLYSERINLLTMLDLCGCLINKVVVYLVIFPHSNCKRVSDVYGLSCSPSTVKQMFCWVTLKRTDQHQNPPSGRKWREGQIEGVSPSAGHTPFFFFHHMGKHINVCAQKPQCESRLFWVERCYSLSLAVFKGWRVFS